MLNSYSLNIKEGVGCLLTCVMGGKMSEGINFKDEMARGVIGLKNYVTQFSRC